MLIPYRGDFLAHQYLDDKTNTYAQAIEWFSYPHWPRHIQTLGGSFDVRGSQASKRKYPFNLTCSYTYKNADPDLVTAHLVDLQSDVGKVGNFWFRASNPIVFLSTDSIGTYTGEVHLKEFKAQTPHEEWYYSEVKIYLTLEIREELTFAFAEYFGPEPVAES